MSKTTLIPLQYKPRKGDKLFYRDRAFRITGWRIGPRKKYWCAGMEYLDDGKEDCVTLFFPKENEGRGVYNDLIQQEAKLI